MVPLVGSASLRTEHQGKNGFRSARMRTLPDCVGLPVHGARAYPRLRGHGTPDPAGPEVKGNHVQVVRKKKRPPPVGGGLWRVWAAWRSPAGDPPSAIRPFRLSDADGRGAAP